MKTNSSIRSIVFAAGAIACLVSAPALAADHGSPAPMASVSETAASTGVAASRPADRKICFNRTPDGSEQVIGSILSHKVCKTKAQWESTGVRFVAK